MCHDDEYQIRIIQAREWDEGMIALYGKPINIKRYLCCISQNDAQR